MKIMPCPLNGPRNIQEFICAGPVEAQPDPTRCTDEEWSAFVWMEENRAGVVREWWCHAATSYWFIAERNTVTDEILATYPADRVFSERVEFEALEPPPEAAPAPAPEPSPTPEPQPAPAEAAPEAPAPEPAPAPETAAEAAPEPSSEQAAPAGDAPAGDAPDADAPPATEAAPAEDAPADDTAPSKPEDSAA